MREYADMKMPYCNPLLCQLARALAAQQMPPDDRSDRPFVRSVVYLVNCADRVVSACDRRACGRTSGKPKPVDDGDGGPQRDLPLPGTFRKRLRKERGLE